MCDTAKVEGRANLVSDLTPQGTVNTDAYAYAR